MRHYNYLFVLSLLAVLLSFGVARAQEGYTLTTETPTVKAGETITFSGNGFGPEKVAYWATAPDGAVYGNENNMSYGGHVTLNFKVPDDALGGRWAMTAYGLSSKTPVVAYFDVIGRDPGTVAPAAYADPAEGGPGTVFTFYASGFKKDERVSWWVTAPDNTVVDARPGGEKANSKGEIRFRWQAPANAMPGTWVMTMQGNSKGVARGAAFVIR